MFIFKVLTFCSLAAFGATKTTDKPIELTEATWHDILEGEWMVEFMAPWCPACRSFKETWTSYAKWSKDLDVSIGVVDVNENPGLSGRFFVTALPSIYHVKDGIFRLYQGSRKEAELISFIDEKKWESVDPVSSWIAPDSIQMSTVGLFFKAAMVIRSFYTMMTTEYGVPEWACYIIFAVFTIITGLVLGLLIVCCCDMIYPPKYPGVSGLPVQPRDNIDQGDDKVDESDDNILDDTKDNEESENTTRRRLPVSTD